MAGISDGGKLGRGDVKKPFRQKLSAKKRQAATYNYRYYTLHVPTLLGITMDNLRNERA